MRIVQINTTYNIGSTGRIVHGIEKRITHAGYESFVAFGYGNVVDRTHFKVINKIDSYKHNIFSRLTDRQGRYSTRKTIELVKRLDAISPDIIHLHNLHGNFLNYEVLFEFVKETNSKVIWTLHDCWPFTGHCAYFDLVGCDRWKTECHNCPQIKSYPPALVDNSCANYTIKKELFNSIGSRLTLVPVSNWLASLISQSFFKNTKQFTIHNGINLNQFNPKRILQNIKPYILGVAFPWDKRKGLQDFIKLRDLLTDDIDIRLVGLSNSQIKNLPNGIIGIQRTNSAEELAIRYSNAIAFINTTYEDNYPTVNMEAIACGTPVITYKTGGSPESVPSQCGYSINQGDIQSLNQCILKIFSKRKLFNKEQLVKFAKDNFNEDNCFQGFIDLYKSVLK